MKTHSTAHHQAHHHATPAIARPTDLASLHGALSGPLPTTSPDRAPREVHVRLEARETEWELAPGKRVVAWGYQGRVPGPTIEAHAGDTLVAHLVNRLPEPTIIHWHGLRVPASMDGTDSVQVPVAPGETFVYRFTLPDAGTYWYHSHHNETVQIERGLYGAIVVRAHGEPVFDADRVLLLDDVKLDGKGRIAGTKLFDRHSGREGAVTLINGKAAPTLAIAAGQVERWRLINAANARYVRWSIGGRPFRIIGRGGDLGTAPLEVTQTLLAPGERVDLAVGPFHDEGTQLALESLPYRRAFLRGRRRVRFGSLRVIRHAASRASLPAALSTVTPLVPPGPVAATRTIRLGARMTLHGHDWLINGQTHHRDAPVKVGELQVWDIVNQTGMDHPFHLHGFFFQVVAVGSVRVPARAWEDTVNVPARSRVTIAFRADNRPGEWMYHCHILEHHAAGMMGHFEVTA